MVGRYVVNRLYSILRPGAVRCCVRMRMRVRARTRVQGGVRLYIGTCDGLLCSPKQLQAFYKWFDSHCAHAERMCGHLFFSKSEHTHQHPAAFLPHKGSSCHNWAEGCRRCGRDRCRFLLHRTLASAAGRAQNSLQPSLVCGLTFPVQVEAKYPTRESICPASPHKRWIRSFVNAPGYFIPFLQSSGPSVP